MVELVRRLTVLDNSKRELLAYESLDSKFG
jgi:hypothetical protein